MTDKTARSQGGFGPAYVDIGGDMMGDYKAYRMPKMQGISVGGPFSDAPAKLHVRMLSEASGRSPVVVKMGSAEEESMLDFYPEETMLKQAFAAEDAQLPYADPLSDSYDLRDKLAGAVDHMTSELSGLEGVYRDVLEDLYQSVKHASMDDGLTLGQVLVAWGTIVPGAEYVKTAFSHIGPRLVEENVFPSHDHVGASLTKVASSGMVNPSHPLVVQMAAYCETLDKLAQTRAARDELYGAQMEIERFMKQATLGGAIGSVLKGARSAGDFAGKHVTDAAEGALGKGNVASGIGTAARLGVTYAPHAAALLAAKEVHDRVRANPTARGLSDYALAQVPGTQQAQQRAAMLDATGGTYGLPGFEQGY